MPRHQFAGDDPLKSGPAHDRPSDLLWNTLPASRAGRSVGQVEVVAYVVGQVEVVAYVVGQVVVVAYIVLTS